MKPPRVPDHIQSLTPYQPGHSIDEIRRLIGLERIIKLASNENPLGPSPKAVERMRETERELSLYPSGGFTLRHEIAKRLDLKHDNVAAASGSEGVLAAAVQAYLVPGDEVITAEGTFIGFYILAHTRQLEMVTVPLREYTFDLEAILDRVSPRTRMIYIPNPNNPTGTAFGSREWEPFLEALPEGIIVVMDEAYFEYARHLPEYPDSMRYRHNQVLTLRTFSKAYGLAGVRIGYGIGHEDVIGNILKVKLPFEPTVQAEAAGLGALEDDDFLELTLKTNREGMARLSDELGALGLPHPPSTANFIFIPLERTERSYWLFNELMKRGIITRQTAQFRLPHGVRITIGTEEEVTILIEALRDLFSGGAKR